MNTERSPILVTGAAGQHGAVGRTVTHLLLDRGLPVRALVRREDDRAAALRAAGAEVVVGDLLDPADVYRAVSGTRRVYFGMSVSPEYLEATVTAAAVARAAGVEALVNMSQMTVSQMGAHNTTPSRQGRGRLQVPGGHGHAEVDPPTAADDPRDVGRFEEIADHHLGASSSQGRRPVVLAADHSTHRQPALEEQAGHGASDRPELTGGPGDED